MSKRWALIIGNSRYRDETLSKLNSPDADVGDLRDTLSNPEFGGFDDVNLLFNSEASVVRKEIYNFFARKKRDDMLLLYFSGHGVLDVNGRLYLAVKDTDTQALRGTAIPASYITDEMDNSRSKRQVLILDCCHSGAFGRGSKGITGASVGTANVFEGSGFGRIVLTASDATQYAWEGDQIFGEAENSLFTHFIIQGITSGEADANKDGNISIDEIYDYAYSQILDKTPKQTPGKWSFKEQGELIIARNPKLEILKQTLDFEEAEKRSDEFELIPEEEKKKRELEDLYSSLLSKMIAGKYHEAKELITKVQTIEKGYKDTDSLLLRVDTYLQEEEKRRLTEKANQSEKEREPKQVGTMVRTERKHKRSKDTGLKLPSIEEIKSLPQRTLWISVGALVIVVASVIFGFTSLVFDWPFGIGPRPTETATVTPSLITQTKTPTIIPSITPTITPSITPISASIINPIDMAVYRYIPAGEFSMGSDLDYRDEDEKPVHTVYLDAFWISETEVTNAQYAQCVIAGLCDPPSNIEYFNDPYSDHPVVYVNWFDAETYCKWAGGSLPNEAQWEKAARGGLEGKNFPWGNEYPVCEVGAENGALYSDCKRSGTMPVRSFVPNGYGLYGMMGNAWEWVMDWYEKDYYESSPAKNPLGPEQGGKRVTRGGAWNTFKAFLHVADRDANPPQQSFSTVGFRCVLTETP